MNDDQLQAEFLLHESISAIKTVKFTMGNAAFPGVKRLGCGLTTHPHLVPRLNKE